MDIFWILIFTIFHSPGIVHLMSAGTRFQRLYGNDDMIPPVRYILYEYNNIETLSTCGAKCLEQLGCCSFFYNKMAMSCITAMGLKTEDLFFSLGYEHYSKTGAELSEGRCFGTSLYLMVSLQESFFPAQFSCFDRNASIVQIESAEENQFIKDLANEMQDTIWIGATDNVIEGDWTWIESGDPLTFTDWGQGQPDNWSPDDDCTAMHKVLDFKWSDEDCNLYSFMYICEINNTNLPMVELG